MKKALAALRNRWMRLRGYRQVTVKVRVQRAGSDQWEDRGVVSTGWAKYQPGVG